MNNLLKKIIRFILKIFWIFPMRDSKVFFMCFDGKVCGFDSKALAEYFLENCKESYELYWATKEKGFLRGAIPGIRLVKQKSFAGLYHMMTAEIFIFDINPPSYIPYRKKQILINTWHGYAYKKCGKYLENFDAAQHNLATCYTSYSKQYSDAVLSDSFCYKGTILKCGAPRNDIFFKDDLRKRGEIIKREIGIDADQNVLLYAPTFRGEFSFEDSQLDFQGLKTALLKRFGGEWVILCRLHPLIANRGGFADGLYINVSEYPDMQNLLAAADILITDYSSSQWDFGLMRRPVFLFAPDFNDYKVSRGFLYPIEEIPFPIAISNEMLLRHIEKFDRDLYISRLNEYYKGVGCYERGIACKSVVEFIRLQHSQNACQSGI